MGVSYTREDKEAVKNTDQKLVTVDAGGLTFQGAVPPEFQIRVVEFYLKFTADLRAYNAEAAKEKPDVPKPRVAATGS
jgi:hypothetical protein